MSSIVRTLRLSALSLALVATACKDEAAESAPAPAEKAAADEAATPEKAEPAEELPKAEDLLARAVEAAGGKEKFDAVESFYQEGQTVIQGQNITATVKLWWKEGDFYSESDMVGIGTVRLGKKGDVAWSDEPINGLRQLEGREEAQAQWSSSLLLAGEWKKYFDEAKTVGKREVEGKTVYDVKLTGPNGDELTMTLDAESGLPVAQSFKQATPMGDTPITLWLSDYRDVDGMKLSFTSVADAGLMKLEQKITKLELNVPVDESKFAMPTGGAEVVKAPIGTPLNELPKVPDTKKPRGPQPGDRPSGD